MSHLFICIIFDAVAKNFKNFLGHGYLISRFSEFSLTKEKFRAHTIDAQPSMRNHLDKLFSINYYRGEERFSKHLS